MNPADLHAYQYETVFISDTHLGSGKTASPYLYEFLKHLDYTKLKDIYLVGDIVGGWEHEDGKAKPMPEMEKRILDIINYAAANGVKIHYIPGNHDEKLRPLVDKLQNRENFDTFSKNISFESEGLFETGGENSKKYKVLHGDSHDPKLFTKHWFRPAEKAVSNGYDDFVRLEKRFARKIYEDLGIDLSAAKMFKDALKKTISFLYSHKSIIESIEKGKLDGIILGHTHGAGTEEIKVGNRIAHIINDGDWVEGASFAGTEKSGEIPQVKDYKKERKKRGFDVLPKETDEHPAHFAAHRTETERQVQAMNALWPQRDRKKLEKAYSAAAQKNEKLQQKSVMFAEALERVGYTGKLDTQTQHLLEKAADTKGTFKKRQKKRLAEIFNKHAAKEKLDNADVVFTQTLLRELLIRNRRDIQKQTGDIDNTARKLDYPNPSSRRIA